MKFDEFRRSATFTIIFPIIIVWGIITIFKGGTAFGSWLYAFIH